METSLLTPRLLIESDRYKTITEKVQDNKVNGLLLGECNSFLLLIIVIFHNEEKFVLNSIPTILNS